MAVQDVKDHYSALPAGARLRDYRIESVLGHGSFGITYKALEEITDRPVAIKEYLPNALAARGRDGTTVRPMSESVRGEFEWGLARFRGEAKVLTSLKHRNIVPALSYFETNGTGYLVMEFQSGHSLGERLAGGAVLSEAEVLTLVTPLLDGIEAVHAKGFLHRDIKPDNIFIRADGTPVLLDFGAARQALSQHSGGLTAVLTEGYAPYEQYQREGHQGPWTDIYALGAVTFRCMLGRVPAVATQRLSAWLRQAPDPLAADLQALRHLCSSNVASVVEAALAVMEQERPQSVGELRRMFVEPPTAARTGLGDSTIMLAAGAGTPATSPAHPIPRSAARVAQRRIAAIAAGIVAAASAVGAAGYFIFFVDASSPAKEAALGPASGPDRSDRSATERKRAEEEEARRGAEEERRKIEAERERQERERAEDEAKRRTQEEERKRVEDEARRKTEDEGRRRAEEEARRKAQEEARRKAEDEASARSAERRRAQDLVVQTRGLIDQARAAMQSARLTDARRFYLEAVAAEREAERLDSSAPGLEGARRELFKLDSELRPLVAARVRALVSEAKQHIETGRYDDAQRVLRDAQRLDPSSAEVAQGIRELAEARRGKSPATGSQPPSRTDVPAHARQLYDQIMQWALRQRTQTLQGAPAATGSYRTLERHKALAICIDWPNSSPAAGIKFGGLGIMQNGTTGNVTRGQALETCASVRPNATCTCTVVDYNDTNVLTFPESYIAKHYR